MRIYYFERFYNAFKRKLEQPKQETARGTARMKKDSDCPFFATFAHYSKIKYCCDLQHCACLQILFMEQLQQKMFVILFGFAPFQK